MPRYFNSRPREGANVKPLLGEQKAVLFQFPPPRGGEHVQRLGVASRKRISIPAPARGRTFLTFFRHFPIRRISIPAPARGRTPLLEMVDDTTDISIPAPARGRTSGFHRRSQRAYFNSRPREGANMEKMVEVCETEFQFPPPRGGEHGITIHRRRPKLFQFPPPRGGEQYGVTVLGIGFISIPAPARGRTSPLPISPFSAIFQFPPPRGGEPLRFGGYAVRSVISIPAPARGRTPRHETTCRRWPISIPAPARGRTFREVAQ